MFASLRLGQTWVFTPTARLGENTEEVLRGLGYDEPGLAELHEDGVIVGWSREKADKRKEPTCPTTTTSFSASS